MFNLMEGSSAETSGGLCVLLPNMESAKGFIKDLEAMDGWPAWVIGEVREGKRGGDKSYGILANKKELKVINVKP